MAVKFALATLYVQDMERALEFYNGLLGLPVVGRHAAGPGGEIVFLGEEGAANLELISSREKVAYAGFSLGFAVEDLQVMKKRLAKKGYPVKREMSPGGGTTLCFLDGPGGEEVELVYKGG